jgi:type IX secretion system PorP/SprF family membrane protein
MYTSFCPPRGSFKVPVKWRATAARLWSSVLLILLLTETVTAQDPQFSQFYAAPLYLNPAFAGSTGQARAGINYRNQWPAIDANFTTMSAYFDYYIADKKSAVGALLTRDTEGMGGFRSLSVALQYSYELEITKFLGFRPGFQVGLFNRDVGFSRLTFGDQIDPNTGEKIRPSSQELAALAGQGSRTFVDLSAGGVLFTRVAWLGFAANHLTTPNQSVIGENAPLAIKYSAHGGFKYFMKPGVVGNGVYARDAERSIAPAFQYRHQGNFDQLDLGVYFTFEPMVLGTWYRGVPFKSVNGFVNNESLVLLLGFVKLGAKDAINIGYSFDYTISKLGPGSGGSHEFSLVYTWPMRNPRKPDPDKLVIPCPDF